MTNEELAVQIQLGATSLYAELWERVKKLMTKILLEMLRKYRTAKGQYKLPNCIEVKDLIQELYFALCKTVQAYDDTKPYKFNTYLEYHIKGVIRSNIKSKAAAEISYNITVGEDGETELLDFIADNIADSTKAKDFERVELNDLQQEVRQAVARLPEDIAEVIRLHYLQGVSYQSIAELCGCSHQLIAEKGRKGLQLLRKDKNLRVYYLEMQQHSTGGDWLFESAKRMWKCSDEYFAAKEQIDQRRAKGEYISYGTEQTLLAAQRTRYIENYIKERRNNAVYV